MLLNQLAIRMVMNFLCQRRPRNARMLSIHINRSIILLFAKQDVHRTSFNVCVTNPLQNIRVRSVRLNFPCISHHKSGSNLHTLQFECVCHKYTKQNAMHCERCKEHEHKDNKTKKS